ncbi:MAG TPA: LEA type 2 family protein [Gemmatimonadaceae bacterium]|nr:LEA type 2 family protein [Gemmatimonadaceae bacterium]
MRNVRVVLGVMIVTVAASCSVLGRNAFTEPLVSLRNVQVNGIGLNGGSLEVLLNVYNPNGFRLDATRLTYKLMVDTIPFGTGATDSNFTVAGKDSMVVRLPIRFSWAGVGEAGRELLNTGTVDYRVLGDITVGSPVGSFTVPYDRRGQFSTLRGRGP